MAVKFPQAPKVLRDLLGRDILWLDKLANKRAEAQADSTATTVAGIVADHNALLAKLRAAGMMDE